MPSKIVLKSSDGEIFEVDQSVAMESETIKHMIEDNCYEGGIPLRNVSSRTLAKIIDYCTRHVEATTPAGGDGDADKASSSSYRASSSSLSDDNNNLKAFDAEFIQVDQGLLFDLITGANYLNIKNLLDLTCQTMADMIKGMTPEEIRETFNIENDYTPEEEKAVREENAWAFE